jgi:voltage-gated potassium channel
MIPESQPISPIGIAVALVAGTVAIHALGSFFLLWSFMKYRASSSSRAGYTRLTATLTLVVLSLLLLHLMEVGLWAAYYHHKDCFPDLRTSVYFSLVTYATVGYGDIVLNEQYRLLGGIEALAGVLMMSWSTAMLIGSVQRVYSQLMERWGHNSRESGPLTADR